MFKSQGFSRVKVIVLFLLSVTFSVVTNAENIDPTKPFGSGGFGGNSQLKSEDGLRLTSIIHGDGIHTAVINGKIYKMFDYVGEYRITAINSHSVILRSESKRLKINVFRNEGFKSHVVGNTVAN